MALKRIYQCRESMEAHLLCNLLAAEGILAHVLDESFSNIMGGLSVGRTGAPSICVEEEDVGRASAFVEAYNLKLLGQEARQESPEAQTPWKCPKCGEVIDPQFTDCWNCQTSRPAERKGEQTGEAVVIEPSLTHDIPCIRCEYNLRGLKPGDRCPECGLPAMRTLLEIIRNRTKFTGVMSRLLHGHFEAAAGPIGMPASALMLVCDAWLYVMEPVVTPERGLPLEPRAIAQEVCMAVRGFALNEFGGAAESKAALIQWGIRSGADILRILRVLMTAGLIEGMPGNWSGGFGGLFTIENMFAEME